MARHDERIGLGYEGCGLQQQEQKNGCQQQKEEAGSRKVQRKIAEAI